MSILSDKTIRDLCTGECSHAQIDVLGYDSDGQVAIGRNKPDTKIDNYGRPMIEPFVPELVREMDTEVAEKTKVISYGTTSYGYDVRLKADEVKLFTNANSAIVDPMEPDDKCFIDATIRTKANGLKYFILPPNSYALAVTMEYFRIPKNVMVVCVGKSTYARSCVLVNTTPIEAGFEGEVVIEVANGSTLPVMVYLETGIAQFMFFRGDQECETSYADGNRKYQGQRGVTLSKV